MLITLGIIGVVAALTMPALVANHQKNVTATKLKKFYTILQNVYHARLAATDARLDCSMVTANNNPEMMVTFWDVNYAPYMKSAGEPQKTLRGIAVPLLDGGGIYIQKTSDCGAVAAAGSCGCMYTVYCVNFKECSGIDNMPAISGVSYTGRVNVNGKSRFVFSTPYESSPRGRWDANAGTLTRDELIAQCRNEAYYYPHYQCTDLIIYDNFEIKDDYPMW